jgi:hypothetical protein
MFHYPPALVGITKINNKSIQKSKIKKYFSHFLAPNLAFKPPGLGYAKNQPITSLKTPKNRLFKRLYLFCDSQQIHFLKKKKF